MSPRAYRSEHRQKQAEQTRERIVEALVEQVLESGRSDFSVAEVAARAGVSERTVYRHFPTREDLIGAIDTHFQDLAQPARPLSLSDWPRAIADLYAWFEENAAYVHASQVTGLGRELHQRARARRGERTRLVLDEWLAPLSPRERRLVFGVVRSMFNSSVWRTMREEVGLTPDEAQDAAEWVARLLIDDVRRRMGGDAEGPGTAGGGEA